MDDTEGIRETLFEQAVEYLTLALIDRDRATPERDRTFPPAATIDAHKKSRK